MLKVHAMGRTVSNDPLQKYKYRVSVPGLPSGMGFTKVSGLKREVNTVTYEEGGYSHTRKLSGKETVDPITLERGAFSGKELQDLYKKILSNPDFRTTATIESLDKFGNPQRSWTLAEAWVKSWSIDDLDSTSDGVLLERIVIEFEHYLD